MDCEKESFESRRGARKAVARRKRFGNKHYHQYRCPICNRWHNSTGKQAGKVDKGEWDDN